MSWWDYTYDTARHKKVYIHRCCYINAVLVPTSILLKFCTCSLIVFLQLFDDTKTFMKTIAKLVIRDSGSTMSDAEMEQKAQSFAEDVFNFESQLANVSDELIVIIIL